MTHALTVGGNTQQLNPEQIQLIKNTVARGATDDELGLFVMVANQTGLNPFTKQIHFVKRRVWNKDKKAYDEVGSIQTGIDGYRAIAARTGKHAGTDNAVTEETNGLPVKSTVTVYRMVEGVRQAFTATARFAEYAQYYEKDGRKELTGQWLTKPFLMIEKCAEALALRKAFPFELSGIYTDEEMGQADSGSTVGGKKKAKVEVIEVDAVTKEQENQKKRIVTLMKALGIAPEATAEMVEWEEAIKKATQLDLTPENFNEILSRLETIQYERQTQS